MKIMILELKIESILEHQADEQKETGDLCRGSVQKGGRDRPVPTRCCSEKTGDD